jgi:tripartite-type tricarboxylate transporter receptor subunit TctC
MRKALQVSALIAALAAALSCAAQAAGYPERTVKVIVPFPAGGVTDIAARVITQKLSERLGEQFYIENIAGAGGNLGMANAARAAADGYTVLFASSSIVVNPSLDKKIPFDTEKDFIPVTEAGASPNSWLVNNDFPARTMNELIAAMKANPGKLSVASPGAGTTPSLSIELLKQGLGVSFVTVPFAGGGPMTQSLLGGLKLRHIIYYCFHSRLIRVPDAVQRAFARCTADPGPRETQSLCGPGSAAHHFVLRCARDTECTRQL